MARNNKDDLTWLGPTDKGIFRLLTIPGKAPICLAGATTYDHLPPLPGRDVRRVSRTGTKITNPFDQAVVASHEMLYDEIKHIPRERDVCVLGGQMLAQAMLEDKLIEEAIICRSSRACFEGIPWTLEKYLAPYLVDKIKINDVQCDFYRIKY